MNRWPIQLALAFMVLVAGACLAFSSQRWQLKALRTDLFEPDQRLVGAHRLVIRIAGGALLALGLVACWNALAPVLG